MSCMVCQSANQGKFPAEMNIHAPHTLKNLDRPTVWAFPSLLVCLDCGFTQFVLEEAQLRGVRANYQD